MPSPSSPVPPPLHTSLYDKILKACVRLSRVGFWLALTVSLYGFLKDVSGIPSAWMPNDKVMHVLVFAVLTFALVLGYRLKPWAIFAWLASYGALVEVLQHSLTNRMGDPWDFLADCIGIGLVLCFSHHIQRHADKWRH